MPGVPLSRRDLVALAASSPLLGAASGKIPVGLELYSVRDRLKEDLMGTVRAVGAMGYEGVEFYAPYFEWTPGYAKDVRKLLDDLGLRCYSTHNSARSFEPGNLDKAVELNRILGSRYVVMASAGRVEGIEGWRAVARRLTEGAAQLKPAGLSAGFHNHQIEFRPVDGVLPIEVLASGTPREVALQLDVGTAVEAGADPVAWVKKNPGRIKSMHLKDWAPAPKGYRVLFSEGVAPWKALFEAAESTGGVEYYLIEQEGSDYPSPETAERCLANYRKLRA